MPADTEHNSSRPASPDTEADTLRKVIHDLNGELFLVRGFVDIALTDLESNRSPAEALRRVEQRTHQIEAAVKRLRSLEAEQNRQ